jgi:hypothetical protein
LFHSTVQRILMRTAAQGSPSHFSFLIFCG